MSRFLFQIVTRCGMALAGARRRRLPIEGGSLVVHASGPVAGEPWILLHGLGATSLAWLPALPAFRGCRVLLPELSALGGTRCPGDALTLGPAIEALAALADQTEGRRINLAGQSLGGWMAVRFALRFPARIDRLLLVNAAGYRPQDWTRVQALVRPRTPREEAELLEALFRRPPRPRFSTRWLLGRAYRSNGVRHVLDTLTEDDAYGDAELASIRAPVGLVWGEADGLFPPEVARRMHRALGRGFLYLLPDCGHVVHWDCPSAFRRAVERFRREARDG